MTSVALRVLLILSALFLSATVHAGLSGRVVSVADGDTLTILDSSRQQHRIRLADIDAPEGGQPFGNRSKQLLSELCRGQTAQVRVRDTDRYGRTIGTVTCNGVDANAELVRQGLAWVYVLYAPAGSPLFALEAEARAQKRGLWADSNPIPPWDWRRGSQQAQQRASSSSEPVRGNQRSMVYHLPHCPGYEQMSPHNRVPFASERAAREAGYRRAGNCR